MEHYIVQIDGRITTVSGKDKDAARQKALSSHPGAYCVKVIDTVNNIYDLVKPYETAGLIKRHIKID